MSELSKNEQDQIVVTLAVDGPSMEEEEFEALYEQLDIEHQMEVDQDVRDYADNAVGDEHWDSDN